MKIFWKKLNKPFFVLAPMDGVTDFVCRELIAKTAKPDVLVTEFTSVEGLFSPGRERSLERLKFSKLQKPIVAQIWGLDPEFFFKAAKLIEELGFDGIDLNMGCPDKAVLKKGACSALINNRELCAEIIKQTKLGAPNLPISVKTRLGYKKIQTEDWLGFLLEQDIQVLTVHGRTVSELSRVPAHWDEIGKVVKLRDSLKKDTLIVGNGDVKTVKQGLSLAKKYQLDGIMIGRGLFANFWLFDKNLKPSQITKKKKLAKLIEHVKLFDKTYGQSKRFETLKKFFKVYVKGFAGANELRIELMKTHNRKQVEEVVK